MKARLVWADGETVETTVADFLADNETLADGERARISALLPGYSFTGDAAQQTYALTVVDLEAARRDHDEALAEWEAARSLFRTALADDETPAHVVAEYRRAVRLAARDLDQATARRAYAIQAADAARRAA